MKNDILDKYLRKLIKKAVLYFEGSRYYHWINEVKSGSRKSILINFWNDDSLKST